MPVRAENRFQVGEPYYLYDVVAELNHNGIYEQWVQMDILQSPFQEHEAPDTFARTFYQMIDLE